MAVYDSAKTRNVGRLVKQMALKMDEDALPMMTGASRSMEGLRGQAARAMEEQAEQLLRAATAICAELEDLSLRMNAYADALELADEKLAEKL